MNESNFTQERTFCIPESVFDDVKVTSYFVFGGLGVIGNILIIILAAKYTQRKNLHYLIINMCVSDILIAILHITEITNISLPNNTPEALANVYCKSDEFLKNTSELLTLTTLLIISIERYRATKFVIGTKSCPKLKLISIAWLLSMLLTSFSLIFRYAARSTVDLTFICFNDNKSKTHDVLYLFKSISLVLLYSSVFFISVLTSIRLSKSNPIQANLSDEQRRRRAKRMINAVRMVLCSLLLYSICYLPDFLEDFIKSIDRSITKGLRKCSINQLNFLLHIPKVVNSCLSPLIYLVFLDDFKRAAKNLIWKNYVQSIDSTQRQQMEVVSLRT